MTTVTWIAGTAGDWFTAVDWSSGVVPGPTDDAVINTPLNGTFTVAGTAVANSLTLNDAVTINVSGTLTVGTLNLEDGYLYL